MRSACLRSWLKQSYFVDGQTNFVRPCRATGDSRSLRGWGLDNNLTRKVSLADPFQIVELKGLIAGRVNLALGLWAGSLPTWSPF